MQSDFFALMARMKYIRRWALMRNAHEENLSEHSLDVAMTAHALVLLHNLHSEEQLSAERAAVLALFHDAPEILTGDMPTPVKYFDDDIMEAYKRVEDVASRTMVDKLPDYMKKYYEPVFFQKEGKEYEWRIVKAADKLSALIKCMQELGSGNQEFKTACETTKEALHKMQMKEVEIFIEEFLPAYDQTLDELQAR